MVSAADLGLTNNQFSNACGIIRAAQARKWPTKAAIIATEAALTESGMRILASANVPASQRYPHDLVTWTYDGLGHDHASMGMFQQQTGYAWCPNGYGYNMNQTTMNSPNGWGTPAELMNSQTSTSKFFDALSRVNWPAMSNWSAAQAVQHSAFSDGSNYRKADSQATRIVNALWSQVQGDDMPTPADVVNALLNTTIPRSGPNMSGSPRIYDILSWFDWNMFNAKQHELYRFPNDTSFPNSKYAVYKSVGEYLLWISGADYAAMENAPVTNIADHHNSMIYRLPIVPGTWDPRKTAQP